MTVGPVPALRFRGYIVQFLMLLSINVPTASFGLAMGWVSLVSGAGSEGSGGGDGGGDGAVVGAAAATFAAGIAGVPLGARALACGRRPALALTSAAFAVCWALTLAGGWWLVGGRLCAGVAGTVAWSIVPLFGKEMVCRGAGGAAAAAPVLAHNLGMLLMYLAADARLQHSTVVWSCLVVSVVHCTLTLFGPESPAYLAAAGNQEEAVSALAWLRGVERDHPALVDELRALPAPELAPERPLRLVKEMLSSVRRRRAFLVALAAVAGQEACGVLSLLQFAERVFQLAGSAGAGAGSGAARLALALGGAQLAAAAAGLWLLERCGRRPLVVWGAVATGASLALAAGGVWAGCGAAYVGTALTTAVAADSLGLQPAPYAILADMFHYQYRGCAVLLVTGAASIANAAETLVFPGVVHAAGLGVALALAATLTLLYAAFAAIYVPETRGKTPEEIYQDMDPRTPHQDIGDNKLNKNTAAEDIEYNTTAVIANTVVNIPADGSVDDSDVRYKVPANMERKTIASSEDKCFSTTDNTARANNDATYDLAADYVNGGEDVSVCRTETKSIPATSVICSTEEQNRIHRERSLNDGKGSDKNGVFHMNCYENRILDHIHGDVG